MAAATLLRCSLFFCLSLSLSLHFFLFASHSRSLSFSLCLRRPLNFCGLRVSERFACPVSVWLHLLRLIGQTRFSFECPPSTPLRLLPGVQLLVKCCDRVDSQQNRHLGASPCLVFLLQLACVVLPGTTSVRVDIGIMPAASIPLSFHCS